MLVRAYRERVIWNCELVKILIYLETFVESSGSDFDWLQYSLTSDLWSSVT